MRAKRVSDAELVSDEPATLSSEDNYVYRNFPHADFWTAIVSEDAATLKQFQSALANHMSSFPTTRPSGSSWALREWKEHRRMLPVLPVSVPEERDQVVFFKLNGQKDVGRRRDGK